MEYISGDNLGDLCLTESMSYKDWKKVFQTTGNILAATKSELGDATTELLVDIFIEKTIARFEKIEDSEILKIIKNPVKINGVTIRPLLESLDLMRSKLNILPKNQIVLHGDMCFANILYNLKTKKVSFVDPRGGFHEPSVYGPAIYDIAKLAQSVYGLYEQVLGDRYSLEIGENEYSLQINRPKFYKNIENLFTNSIIELDLEKEILKILAGLMLAGTPKFHIDTRDRAIALALQSAILLSGDF
jgi:5-methylthioribose kinase